MKKYTSLLVLLVGIITSGFSQAESDIVITEIYYNAPGTDSLEFIEIYNRGAAPINLYKYSFSQGVNFMFPDTTINPGQLFVLANDTAYLFRKFVVSAPTFQLDTSSLQNNGEAIALYDSLGVLADSVRYNDKLPWDTLADGWGRSLVLCNPDTNNNLGYHWTASFSFTGVMEAGLFVFISPGTLEGCVAPGEIFPPRVIDIEIPDSVTVMVVFDEPTGLSAENIANYTGIDVGVTSAVRSATKDTVILTLTSALSIGIYDTLTVANIADTTGNVMAQPDTTNLIVHNNTTANLVITELMYNNPLQDTIEFVEILNNGASPAQIGGYRFNSGISFRFPTMTLNAGQYVVVAKHPSTVDSFFGTSGTLQWRSGGLSNGGERVAIENTVDVIIDSLTYSDTIPWPNEGDGLGSSIILCDPATDNSDHTNWKYSYSPDFVGNLLGASIFASPGSVNNCPVGILEDELKAEKVNIFPNPTNGDIAITLEDGDYEISIYNTLGEVVHRDAFNGSSYTTLLKASPGLYVIRIHSAEKLYFGKFIVN